MKLKIWILVTIIILAVIALIYLRYSKANEIDHPSDADIGMGITEHFDDKAPKKLEAEVKFPNLPKIVHNLGLNIPTKKEGEVPDKGMRECTFYYVDPENNVRNKWLCDVGLYSIPSFLFRYFLNKNMLTNYEKSLFNEILVWRDKGNDDDCKINFKGWFAPTTLNNKPYANFDHKSYHTLGTAGDWPTCYKQKGLPNEYANIDSKYITNVNENPWGNDNGDKWTGIHFNKTGHVSLSELKCMNKDPPPDLHMDQKRFLRLKLNPDETIAEAKFVEYDSSSTPNFTDITDEILNNSHRTFYMAKAYVTNLLAIAMVYPSAKIHRFNIDKCGIVRSVWVNYRVNTSAEDKFVFSFTRNLYVRKSHFISTFSVVDVADKYAKSINDGAVGSEYTGHIVNIKSKIKTAFANIVGKKLVNMNMYSMTADFHTGINSEFGYMYISLGNNLIPTEDDITATNNSLPTLTVTDGVTECISDGKARDRNYDPMGRLSAADRAAIAVCSVNKDKDGIPFTGWKSKDTATCTDGAKYTCAAGLSISKDNLFTRTDCMDDLTAQQRGFNSLNDAATKTCISKGFKGAVREPWHCRVDASGNKIYNYRCGNPNDIDPYIYSVVKIPQIFPMTLNIDNNIIHFEVRYFYIDKYQGKYTVYAITEQGFTWWNYVRQSIDKAYPIVPVDIPMNMLLQLGPHIEKTQVHDGMTLEAFTAWKRGSTFKDENNQYYWVTGTNRLHRYPSEIKTDDLAKKYRDSLLTHHDDWSVADPRDAVKEDIYPIPKGFFDNKSLSIYNIPDFSKLVDKYHSTFFNYWSNNKHGKIVDIAYNSYTLTATSEGSIFYLKWQPDSGTGYLILKYNKDPKDTTYKEPNNHRGWFDKDITYILWQTNKSMWYKIPDDNDTKLATVGIPGICQKPTPPTTTLGTVDDAKNKCKVTDGCQYVSHFEPKIWGRQIPVYQMHSSCDIRNMRYDVTYSSSSGIYNTRTWSKPQ